MRIQALIILVLLTTGCTQFPEVENATGAEAEAADYPDLVPLDPLLSQVVASETDLAAEEEQLQARASGLQARANRLRGSVLASEERNRLEESLQ
ncbi:hypothetical protein ACOTTU_16805 [Roseobacter sp. EG26]|uniref:hypothetical protein n=1 Tax=Roseobacter sp. EG26 TaxID=3412477 RepID=UPI00261C71BC|nr:hypothetical protein [uncultured Roseobacter sp.]